MKSSYLLSIIIPVYNGEKFIHRMVNSILNQEYRNFELLLINDGSTDDSLIICQKYAAKDERIKVITQKNQGVSTARNIGLSNATGDYLLVCDQDDELETGMIEKMMAQAIKYDSDIVRCNYKVVSNSHIVDNILDYPYEELLDERYLKDNILPYTLYIKNEQKKVIGGHWTMIVKSALIRANNISYDLFSNKMADSRYIIDVLYVAKSIVFVKEAFYHWIKRDDSQTHSYSPMFDDIKHFQEYYQKLFINEAYDFSSDSKNLHDIEMIKDSLELVWLYLKGAQRKKEMSRILSDSYTQKICNQSIINLQCPKTWRKICTRICAGSSKKASRVVIYAFVNQRVKRMLKKVFRNF